MAKDQVTLPPFAAFYERASRVSAAFMCIYRGYFVLAFLLAATAVAAAVGLLAVAVMADGHPSLATVLCLGLLKIGLLAFLLRMVSLSRQERFQEHATDFRYLAELLRPMEWLAPVGACVPAVELPAHYRPLDPRQSWMQWLFRAIYRAVPSVACNGAPYGLPREVAFDRTKAEAAIERANEYVAGQLKYHRDTTKKMHRLESGLEALNRKLLMAVLAFASCALILEVATHLIPHTPGPIRTTIVILGSLAAALPALIAALGGIVVQAEARRLRIRSEAMFEALAEQQKRLSRGVAGVTSKFAVPGGGTWRVAQILRRLAGDMIQEASDWKALYPQEIRAS